MRKAAGVDGEGSGSGKKTFVLDTNVLIHDPDALEFFEDNNVVIPITVIEELDNRKSGVGLVPYSARKALRKIDAYRKKGDISEGVALPGGGTLRITIEKENYFAEHNADNQIISCAIALKKNGVKNVIMISKDTGVRIKANAMKMLADDYMRDKSTLFQKYGRVLEEGDYENGILSVRYKKSSDGGIKRIWGTDQGCLIRDHRDLLGIKPRNPEQICALDALTSPDIHVVALTGIAGGGKTFLSLAAALHQTTKTDPLFDQVVVLRASEPMNGHDMGFMPGNESEKTDPCMGPIHDNLNFLVKTAKDMGGDKEMKNSYSSAQYFIDKGIVDLKTLAYMRGRTLPNRYILVDDAQNLRPLDVKTAVTRMGEGSKIIFAGDLDQIDTPYLDAESNGLAYLIARLINEEYFCYLNFRESERNELINRMIELL